MRKKNELLFVLAVGVHSCRLVQSGAVARGRARARPQERVKGTGLEFFPEEGLPSEDSLIKWEKAAAHRYGAYAPMRAHGSCLIARKRRR